ncbi:similar to Saccharomyces cerevisiae YBR213W MET8 Bifunctional dehydrogenase and ferrochelatase, involved in the biosynthesis of siroheme, a prosthetic group used by sulfite reductase [Maudiozyma saulgeensis]|uniref:precorrin-2 dehydrogenase n=1 Tax=Maudiozyma saulgeensis TaxID=1789683 RepID=A0A1X7R1J8_9SACH|nr:similar to Saccharomyces cerevisiae YBR213W MET8 Bifunctional dehydrogenase and ferrochelatase, involved in the biosynthesis of siroheme, a prosthetic group used by sulfite reductase [Kazachstania saulgeensis]
MLSLQLAHRLENRHVLLIGAGDVAVTRIPKLLPTGCKLTIISPSFHNKIRETFPPEWSNNIPLGQTITNANWDSQLQQAYRVVNDTYKQEYFSLESAWSLILVCISDHAVSRQIYEDAISRYGCGQMINVADVPPLCNFYFGANATLAQGKLQVLVSTNGLSPRFSAILRDDIEQRYNEQDGQLDLAIEKLGQLRSRVRTIACNPQDVAFRMNWVKVITDRFGLPYCHTMDVDKLTHLFTQMYRDATLQTDTPVILTDNDFPTRDQILQDYSQ